MRLFRLAALGGALSLALALSACGTAEGPGWTFQPAPSVTPAPSGEPSGEPGGSGAPSGEPGGSGAPSGDPGNGGGESVELTAQNIAYTELEKSAPADAAFQIVFINEDNVPHDVDIRDGGGATIDDNEIIATAGEITYDVPALPAGTYTYICSVHPIPAMTGTLTVQ